MHFRHLTVMLSLLLVVGCVSPKGVYHTVHKGETLYRIGKTYGVDARYLARINRIDDPTQLNVGDRLLVPGAGRVLTVPKLPSYSSKPSVSKPTASSNSKSLYKTVRSVPAPSKTATKSKPVYSSVSTVQKKSKATAFAMKGQFAWPVKGKILRFFRKSGSRPCKGIEIASQSGGVVRAATAGRVTYSGNGIRGYGNLIILAHDNSFFTVYGYNSKNLVKKGAYVSKGQKIALCGSPPSGGTPRLYFEIRNGKDAVNPKLYLP